MSRLRLPYLSNIPGMLRTSLCELSENVTACALLTCHIGPRRNTCHVQLARWVSISQRSIQGADQKRFSCLGIGRRCQADRFEATEELARPTSWCRLMIPVIGHGPSQRNLVESIMLSEMEPKTRVEAPAIGKS